MFGPASDYVCVTCGGQAKHWAYQYPDGPTQGETGRKFSENFFDYAPMCIGCHRSFDISMEPGRWQEFSQKRQQAGQAAIKRLLVEDPDWVKYRVDNMSAINQRLRECLECGKVANPGAIGFHQKRLAHSGVRDV